LGFRALLALAGTKPMRILIGFGCQALTVSDTLENLTVKNMTNCKRAVVTLTSISAVVADNHHTKLASLLIQSR
jgi:hypothetical protein